MGFLIKTGFDELLLIIIVIGCTSAPDTICPLYVSPYPFRKASCDEIKDELIKIQKRILEIAEIQDSEATKNAW